MGRGSKGGGFGYASGPSPESDYGYHPRGPPKVLRYSGAIDCCFVASFWVSIPCWITTLVLCLCLAFATAPASQTSNTIFLQAGTPVGQTWLNQLPSSNLFSGTQIQVEQFWTSGPNSPRVKLFQFDNPPPLLVDATTLEVPIIPSITVTGGIDPANWAWQGYGINQYSPFNVSVSCSLPVNICLATSQDQFDHWTNAATEGTRSLGSLNSHCSAYSTQTTNWTYNSVTTMTDFVYIIIASIDVGSPAWTEYNYAEDDVEPPQSPSSTCEMSMYIIDGLYNTSTAIKELWLDELVTIDSAMGPWMVLQAPNVSDSANQHLVDGIQTQADQYEVAWQQQLNWLGTPYFLLVDIMLPFLILFSLLFGISSFYLCCYSRRYVQSTPAAIPPATAVPMSTHTSIEFAPTHASIELATPNRVENFIVDPTMYGQ